MVRLMSRPSGLTAMQSIDYRTYDSTLGLTRFRDNTRFLGRLREEARWPNTVFDS